MATYKDFKEIMRFCKENNLRKLPFREALELLMQKKK